MSLDFVIRGEPPTLELGQGAEYTIKEAALGYTEVSVKTLADMVDDIKNENVYLAVESSQGDQFVYVTGLAALHQDLSFSDDQINNALNQEAVMEAHLDLLTTPWHEHIEINISSLSGKKVYFIKEGDGYRLSFEENPSNQIACNKNSIPCFSCGYEELQERYNGLLQAYAEYGVRIMQLEAEIRHMAKGTNDSNVLFLALMQGYRKLREELKELEVKYEESRVYTSRLEQVLAEANVGIAELTSSPTHETRKYSHPPNVQSGDFVWTSPVLDMIEETVGWEDNDTPLIIENLSSLLKGQEPTKKDGTMVYKAGELSVETKKGKVTHIEFPDPEYLRNFIEQNA